MVKVIVDGSSSTLNRSQSTTPSPSPSPPPPPPPPSSSSSSFRRQKRHWKEVAVQLVAGGVAGASSRTITSPLERIKILFQVQNGPQLRNVPGGLVWGTLRQVYREEGLRGYFKVQFNLVQSHQHFITNNAITQLAVYEYVKSMILADTAATGHMELNTGEKLFAGALAGIASVATTYPLDIARTRLSLLQLSIDSRAVAVDAATAATAPRSMIGVMRYIYKEEGGLIGLYRGMSPTTLGVAPYVALNFTFYESMKGLVDKDGRPPSVAYKLFCGGFAGAMAQTLTYPLDLIRRRFQVMNLKAEAGGFTYHYSSTGDAFRQIIRHEGLRGLYKGCLPNYLKVVPAIAVSFVSYETVKQLLTPKLIS